MAARRPNITKAEQQLAAALVRAAEPFEYEPKEFRIHHPNGKQRGFHPDFFLTQQRLYIEVGNLYLKGTKLRWMRCAYPNVFVLVVDNGWGEEIDKLDGTEVLPWLWEKWVEQEYFEERWLHRRHQAREEARTARLFARKGPSMRAC